jgi:hypothetical protein
MNRADSQARQRFLTTVLQGEWWATIHGPDPVHAAQQAEIRALHQKCQQREPAIAEMRARQYGLGPTA